MNDCPICLSAVENRGGRPLTTPGCCGAWFHQDCFDQLLRNGVHTCPSCRATMTVPIQNLSQQVNAPFPSSFGATTTQFGAVPTQNYLGAPFPSSLGATTTQFGAVPTQNYLGAPFPSSLGAAPTRFGQPSRMPRHQVQQQRYVPLPEDELAPVISAETETEGGAIKEVANKDNKDESSKRLTVCCIPERKLIGPDEQSSFYVNVSIASPLTTTANEGPSTTKRHGMDLVCVLDNSGSMTGAKLASVKSAMRYVRSQLQPQDRLSVVIFNSYASGLHGLYRMTDERKTESGVLLDAIYADGGTNIYDGMNFGFNVLKDRKQTNTLSCMFLLTDGQDGSFREERKALGAQMRQDGVALYVFGFGADHDSQQLSEIASSAEGDFIYVERDEMVIDAFGGALGGQQGTTAKNLTLTVTCTDPPADLHQPPGTLIQQTMAGDFSTQPAADKRSVQVIYANLFTGEKRDVLLRLSVPALPAAAGGGGAAGGSAGDLVGYPLVSATVSYQSVDGESCFAVATTAAEETRGADSSDSHSPVKPAAKAATATVGGGSGASSSTDLPNTATCVVRRSRVPLTTEELRDLAVDAQINRMTATGALQQSLDLADKRKFDEAETILQAAVRTITASRSAQVEGDGKRQAAANLEDLQDAIGRMRDRHAFFSAGGRAEIEEATRKTAKQRSAYTKCAKASYYQSASSASVQMNSATYRHSGYLPMVSGTASWGVWDPAGAFPSAGADAGSVAGSGSGSGSGSAVGAGSDGTSASSAAVEPSRKKARGDK